MCTRVQRPTIRKNRLILCDERQMQAVGINQTVRLVREHEQPGVEHNLTETGWAVSKTASNMHSGRRRTGKRICPPQTTISGRMIAHPLPSILHSLGTTLVVKTMTPAMVTKQRTNAVRNRFQILGTSRKKLERSTSLAVAPQVML